MTNLELVLIYVAWLLYGFHIIYQHDFFINYDGKWFLSIPVIVFSPFILIYRIVRGIFHKFH